MNWNAAEDDSKDETYPPSDAKATGNNSKIFEILARKYAMIEKQKGQPCCSYREREDDLGYPVILRILVLPPNKQR